MNLLYSLIGDWRHVLPFPWPAVALTLVALACGMIIGTERQRREKPAGLRTLMLVCLGSAAFTMVSFVFTTTTGDSGRVSAQIVTGIGFLGAGVILHGRSTVSGTTTAATIWIAAAVGMVAGSGYAAGALGLSVLVRMVLGGIAVHEVHLAGGFQEVVATLDFDPDGGKTRVRLARLLVDYPEGTVVAEWKRLKEGQEQLTMRLHLPRHHLRELLDDMVNVPGVNTVHEEPVKTSARK